MNDGWREFLIAEGAHYDGDQLLGFGAEAVAPIKAETDNLLCELGYLGLLRISGEDAAVYLQNLLSNDVRAVTESQSQLNSFCTAKGRMLAIFRLFKRSDDYFLRIPRDIMDALARRLQMYVLRSKVKIDLLTDQVGIGISGPKAAALLSDRFKLEPLRINEVQHPGDYSVLRVPGADRLEIYAPVDAMQTLWMQLKDKLKPVSGSFWRLLEIQNGIPTVYAATSEHFVPQMTNLQLVGGLSFKKGCYPGQEVVARMQYLGKLKRRMLRVTTATEHPPAPGTPIVLWDGERSHEAGEVVDACACGECVEALAVLPIADVGKPLHIGDQNGPQLEMLTLPYDFADDAAKA